MNQPYQLRLIEERRELAEKVSKLATFLQSATFTMVPPAEQMRLQRQCVAMTEYLNILDERLAAIAA